MIFVARGVAVSLAFFTVVYCFLSLLALAGWKCLDFLGGRAIRKMPTLWFGLRVFPFVISAAISLFFTFPSFLLFETHALDEDSATLVLTACGLLFVGAGLFRVLNAQARTTQVVAQWLAGTNRVGTVGSTPVVVSAGAVPPVLLVGIRSPQILISDSARALLSDRELRIAVQHEIEHARSRDNLKKVIVNCIPFPGMAALEKAWQEAAELAADNAAATNRGEALDLAAALIKLSRSFPLSVIPVLTTGLVSVSPGLVSARVERLLAWQAAPDDRSISWRYAMIPACATAILLVVSHYGATLVLAHRLTERLVP